MANEFLTVDEISREFRVGKSTTYRLVESGEIQVVRIGGVIRVRRAAIEEFIKRSESKEVPA